MKVNSISTLFSSVAAKHGFARCPGLDRHAYGVCFSRSAADNVVGLLYLRKLRNIGDDVFMGYFGFWHSVAHPLVHSLLCEASVKYRFGVRQAVGTLWPLCECQDSGAEFLDASSLEALLTRASQDLSLVGNTEQMLEALLAEELPWEWAGGHLANRIVLIVVLAQLKGCDCRAGLSEILSRKSDDLDELSLEQLLNVVGSRLAHGRGGASVGSMSTTRT